MNRPPALTSCGGTWELRKPGRVTDDWWSGWDELNERNTCGHPLLAADTAALLLRHFGTPSVRCATFLVAGKPAGYGLVEQSGRGKWRFFTPSQAPVSPLVLQPECRDAVWLLPLLLRKVGLSALALEVPLNDDECQFRAHPSSQSVQVDYKTWGTTIAIRDSGSFSEYWAARPKALRSNVRRYFKRAEETLGPLRYERIVEPQAVSGAVADYGELESLGWKGRSGTALHASNSQGRFYAELMARFASRGRAHAFRLMAGERLLASRLMIASASMSVMLKTTYDESLRACAPGRLLTYLAIQDLLSNCQTRSIEFYTRANADMLQWATHQRELRSIAVYRGWPVRVAVRVRRAVRKFRGGLVTQPGTSIS